ncbi:ornithine decarboxylase [Escherichia coli]|nr:ornithine decarboxylase [Escherichia coli]
MLTTPGIDARNGEYEAFGVPATILANFLRENGVVPEKCDLNSILFLLTPAEDMAKLQQLVALLVRFEKLLESDAPLAEVLPSIYKQHEERYAGYTLRQLCQEMHDLYARHNVKQLQKEMFRKEHFPRVSMNPQEANYAYLRGEVELVRLPDAEGRIAAEGALPYPPVCCVLFRVKSGVVLFCVTSALWKKGSTCCQVLHRSCRVSISKNMMVVSKFGAMSSSLVMRKAPC